MLELHNEAQRLSARAAEFLDAGSIADARELFRSAALLERKAFDNLRPEQKRTRGILGVSLVSQLYKAQDYKDARTAAHRILANPELLPEFAVAQLYEALDIVADELQLQAIGRQYASRSLDIHLSGGEIYSGSAPADLAIYQMNAWQSLIVRVAEFRGKFTYRQRGLPASELLRQLAPRLVAPTAGSFRFTVRLTEPANTVLPGLESPHHVEAADVIEGTMSIIRSVSEGNVASVRDLVPDEAYRRTITGLVRSVTPGGKRIGEVKIAALSVGVPISRIALSKDNQKNVKEVVDSDLPSEPDGVTREVEGNLRGAHLDRRWVELKPKDGSPDIRLRIHENIANDVVAPMLDRDVRVAMRQVRNDVYTLLDVSLIEE